MALATWCSESFSPVILAKSSALAQELDKRCAVEETGHADQIVDVVAVQPEGRRRHDVVGSAILQLVGRQYRWFRAVHFLFRDEFEIVRRDVEYAAGAAIGKRQGETTFTGDETDVPDRRAAKVTWIMTQIAPTLPPVQLPRIQLLGQ